MEGSGDPVATLLTEYKLTKQDLVDFSADPVFVSKLGDYRKQIKEKGLTFKLKARAQAEELLTTSWLLIHDKDVSAAVKADLIKSTVRWAGLDDSKAPSENAGGGVSIVINMGNDDPPMKVIEHDGD